MVTKRKTKKVHSLLDIELLMDDEHVIEILLDGTVIDKGKQAAAKPVLMFRQSSGSDY